MLKLLAISGDGIGAGKTYAAAVLAQYTVTLADGIRAELKQKFPQYDWYNRTQAYKANTLVPEYGEDFSVRRVLYHYGQQVCINDPTYWVKDAANAVENLVLCENGLETVALDDIRKVCEIQYLRERFPNSVTHLHVVNRRALYEVEFENEQLRDIADYRIDWSREPR